MSMTAQEILTESVTRLRKQGRWAYFESGNYCVYRTNDGLGCAVGILLPDDIAPGPRFKGDVYDLFEDVPRAADILGEENKPLLQSLQRAHDHWGDGNPFPEDEFRAVARDFGLIYPEPT